MPRPASSLLDAPSPPPQADGGRAPDLRRQPLNLNQTITLALLLVTASVVLAAVALHNLHRRVDRDLAQEQRVRLAGEVLAAQFPFYAREEDGPGEWARRAKVHGDVLMAAVLDPNRSLVAVHPNQPQWVRQLERYVPWAPATARVAWPPVDTAGQRSKTAYVVRLDAPDGRGLAPNHQLILVLRGSMAGVFNPSQFWTFHVPLLLISLIGLGLGLFWLRRQVLIPISRLSRMAVRVKESTDLGKWPVPAERQDEIGQLANALRSIHVDLEQWRKRATRLERDFDRRVATETKQIAAALNRATRQAWLDGLTGLHNRHALDEKLGEFYEAQAQAGCDLAVAMFDLDNFKILNDTRGHAAGDEVLEFVGELLRTALRSGDVAFRYGGDEFLLLCPDVSAHAAASIAERLVRLFHQRACLVRTKPELSLSAGVASIHLHHPADAADLLRMADDALYEAKRSGKAKVYLYDPTLQTAPTA